MTSRRRAASRQLLSLPGCSPAGVERPTATPTPPRRRIPARAPRSKNRPRADPRWASPTPVAKLQAADARDPRWRVLDALWGHQAAGLDRRAERRTLSPAANNADVGDVAVVQDEGDLVLSANTIDVNGRPALHAATAPAATTCAGSTARSAPAVGTRVTLSDDDSVAPRRAVRVLVLRQGAAGRVRQFRRQHHVRGGGQVELRAQRRAAPDRTAARRAVPRGSRSDERHRPHLRQRGADQYTVTWCNVRGFDSPLSGLGAGHAPARRHDRVQVRGTELSAPASSGSRRADDRDFTPVNLSDAGPTGGGSGAIGERFARQAELDTVALTQKFYSTHPDNYDQLVRVERPDTHQRRVRVRGRRSRTRCAASASTLRPRRATSAARRAAQLRHDGLAGQVSRRSRSRNSSARTTR